VLEDGPEKAAHKTERGEAGHERNAYKLQVAGENCMQDFSRDTAPDGHPAKPTVLVAGVAHLLRKNFEHFFSELAPKRGRIEK
jgi:hypothetical protein